MQLTTLADCERAITECRLCPRLRAHCQEVARVKRRAYRECDYWGLPVAGFGDAQARLLVLGLAPGAHGANRTGRIFTGDRSGDWLYRALYRGGFANQPESTSRGDGLQLSDCYVSASVRCAPPDNKPTREEIAACRPFLASELRLLDRVRVVVALGRLAFDNYLALRAEPPRSRFVFAHDRAHRLAEAAPLLISSYHPSQQNTLTGRLSEAMLAAVFEHARKGLG